MSNSQTSLHEIQTRNFIKASRSTVKIPLSIKLVTDESIYDGDSTSSKQAYRSSLNKTVKQLQTVMAVDVTLRKEEVPLSVGLEEPIEEEKMIRTNGPIAWKQVAYLTKI